MQIVARGHRYYEFEAGIGLRSGRSTAGLADLDPRALKINTCSTQGWMGLQACQLPPRLFVRGTLVANSSQSREEIR